MLASDVNNPDFVGSSNPDGKLFVEFYMHEPEDMNKSIEAGRKIRGPSTPYVRIQVPGDKTSVIETPVREDHKARWPSQWLYFQMKEGLVQGDVNIPGWPIEEWDYLHPDQVRELKYLRFQVVEQIAGASDEQCQRIGINAVAMREAAKRALREKMGAETREELAKKDEEIAALKAADAEKEERLKKLEEAMRLKNTPAEMPPEPAKKRGRPKGSKNKPTELAVVDRQVSG